MGLGKAGSKFDGGEKNSLESDTTLEVVFALAG
jgi:hypothetical protein